MLENPDFPEPGMPEFLMAKVPYVPLKGSWPGDQSQVRYRKKHAMPRYDDPAYQAAFDELNGLLADRYNGSPDVEYMDTMMYGFWGEGHSWPFEGNTFPSNAVAAGDHAADARHAARTWTKTPHRHQHAARLQQCRQCGAARPHGSLEQLDPQRHHLHREHADRGAEQPAAWTAAISEVPMTTGAPDQLDIARRRDA